MRTDRHDETNSRFSQFCKRAKDKRLGSTQGIYCKNLRVYIETTWP